MTKIRARHRDNPDSAQPISVGVAGNPLKTEAW